MIKHLLPCLGLLALCASSACHAWFFNTDYPEPPPILRTTPPSAEEAIRAGLGRRDLNDQIVRFSLNRFHPLIPDWSKNKSGYLLASWNPVRNGQKNPAVVIQHGGMGGAGTAEFGHGAWFKKQGYHVVVLDSFWSRGFIANWRKIDAPVAQHGRAFSELGPNTRARDAFATAQWLREQPEVDSARIFLIGGSQGGWSVLRAFTDEKSITVPYQGLFRAGVSIYPVCWSWQQTPGQHANGVSRALNPRLGPYHSPLLILTVGLEPPGSATDKNVCDPQIFKSAEKHIHYPDQTHGFDAEPYPGQPRGQCGYSLNPHWCGSSGGRGANGNCVSSPKPDFCEDTTATEIARQEMLTFLAQFK